MSSSREPSEPSEPSGRDADDEDILVEAIVALRDKKSADADAAATRRIVLAAALKSRKHRAVVVRVVLPLAAVLLVSTAWAAATGRLPRILGVMSDPVVSTREHVALAPPPPASSALAIEATPTVTTTTTTTTTTTAPAPPASPPSASPFASAKPIASAAVVAATAATTASSSTTTEAATDPEETLYRKAHQAHFTDHDYAKSLAGWDAYLAAHPTGRFAPEARYNRALSLVRLGRRDEAKSALQPFADGVTFAGYRQSEAKSLLDAMTHD